MSDSNTIDVTDLVTVLVKLQASFAQIDHTAMMRQFSNTLQKQHAGYFDSRSGPGGDPWPPLSPWTVARKRHDRPLIDTGRLRSSLTRHGGDALREISDGEDGQKLLFGTSVPYSSLHQVGWANVPARPHVGTDETTVSRFADEVADAVVKELQAG